MVLVLVVGFGRVHRPPHCRKRTAAPGVFRETHRMVRGGGPRLLIGWGFGGSHCQTHCQVAQLITRTIFLRATDDCQNALPMPSMLLGPFQKMAQPIRKLGPPPRDAWFHEIPRSGAERRLCVFGRVDLICLSCGTHSLFLLPLGTRFGITGCRESVCSAGSQRIFARSCPRYKVPDE